MSTRVTLRHADWLSLVDPTGPFLTLPVLRRVWPGGLDRTPASRCAEVREQVDGLGRDETSRRRFVDWVLRRLLGFGSAVREGQQIPETLIVPLAEHQVVLRPDLAVVDDTAGRPRLLVSLWPAGTDFAAHVPAERWAASPVDRMATHLRSTGMQLGLITDGDRFCLVWAPRTGPVGRATWVASVFTEAAERTLLDSFTSVLGAKRFFAVAQEDQLEALLSESASAQAEVTSQLGLQVRQAVELLVAAFSRANREHRGALLSAVNPNVVYEAACTVMMRLVFLLSAEERRLLPLGDELYDRSYAVSTLRQELRDTADRIGNDEVLEHTYSAWPRLLATFRAVHGGLSHDQLRLPAYGGRLFDPDRYPFLEGRAANESWHDTPATPMPVDDRTMLGVLNAVQILEMREGGVTEARRLSFRSLDVEQIGHVYEGLLDHGARRIDTVTLGLVGRLGEEAEVTLAQLELYAEQGDSALVLWLTETAKRTDKQVRDALDKPLDDGLRRRLLAACDNDSGLAGRLQRYAWLLRDDIRHLPMVLLPGSVTVTEVSQRRDSGTEYTTKELADEVVRYALEPLVYSPGPADGAPPETWKLKSSADILALRVCDPAVGSGAIITAACRYLAERLVEAWAAERITPLAARPAADGEEVDDVLIAARREVAERCLYGVDRDPMAVEMAKLSLWLITMAKERPFSFLDHAFRPGDSLLGITELDQVTAFTIDPHQAVRPFNLAGDLEPLVKEALELRRRIEEAPVVDVRHAEEKRRLLDQADRAMRTVAIIADLVVGAALSTAGGAKNEEGIRLAGIAGRVRRALAAEGSERDAHLIELADQAAAWLNERRPAGAPLRRPLHWPLAFPEVFLDGGPGRFDAMVGNPPFLGGTKISGPMGDDYRQYLAFHIAKRRTSRADLVSFFFLRVASIADAFGLLATNTISQGDTRETGLDHLLQHGWHIARAVKSRPWPGSAVLAISQLWMTKIPPVQAILDDQPVRLISSILEPAGRAIGAPFRLSTNAGLASKGSDILGMGFALSQEEAKRLIGKDGKNGEVLQPFLNGEDLNSHPQQMASRWIINFGERPEEEARRFPDCFKIVEQRVMPDRMTKDGVKYPRMVNEWWKFWNTRVSLYEKIGAKARVIVITRHSKFVIPALVPTGQVFSDAVVVFPVDCYGLFGLLSSGIHGLWVSKYASTMRTDIRYTPTDCFETFAQPELTPAVGGVGRRLDTHRRHLMMERSEGLTATYNRVHRPDETATDIVELRRLHEELDHAVAAAYGWEDLDLAHGFWETRQGMRYTVGPEARTELLDRLLELNHERHAAEEAAGAAKPKGKRKGARRQVAAEADGKAMGEDTLFGTGLLSGEDA